MDSNNFEEKICDLKILHDSIMSDVLWLELVNDDYEKSRIDSIIQISAVPRISSATFGGENIRSTVNLCKYLLYRRNIIVLLQSEFSESSESYILSGMMYSFVAYLSENDIPGSIIKFFLSALGHYHRGWDDVFFFLLSSLSFNESRKYFKKTLNELLKFCDLQLYFAAYFRLALEEEKTTTQLTLINISGVLNIDLTIEFIVSQYLTFLSNYTPVLSGFRKNSEFSLYERYDNLELDRQSLLFFVIEGIKMLQISFNFEELFFSKFILRHLRKHIKKIQDHATIKTLILNMIFHSLRKLYCEREIQFVSKPANLRNDALCHFQLSELSALAAQNLACDMSLYTSVVRYFCSVLENMQTYRNEKDFISIINVFGTCLCPGLSYFSNNPSIAGEVWIALKQLDYHVRYRIYKLWEETGLQRVRHSTRLKTQKALRRLSKEHPEESGRKIGKIANNNPLIVSRTIVFQVKAYSNMIISIVDSLRYMSLLSFDTLMYSILKEFTENKEKIKDDGLNSSWFSALSKFCGHASDRYEAIDIQTLLQYILNAIRDKQTADLLILKEILQTMSGSRTYENLNKYQIESLAGGVGLQNQAINASNLFTRSKLKSIQRLRFAFKNGSEPLINPFLILMARNLQSMIFSSELQSLLILTKALDSYDEIFTQYIEFLQIAYTDDEFKVYIPNFATLEKYYINPEIIYKIHRPIRAFDFKAREKGENSLNLLKSSSTMHLKPLLELAPASSILYSTFWSLSLYHIYVPERCYDGEILKLSSSKLNSSHSCRGFEQTRTLESIDDTINLLKLEHNQQISENVSVQKLLSSRKDILFQEKLWLSEDVSLFMQNFVSPRNSASFTDALFTAKFLAILRQMNTLNFDFFIYLNAVFEDVNKKILCSSDLEAERYGLFLDECLKEATYSRFIHADKIEYISLQGKKIIDFSKKKIKYLINWHQILHNSLISSLKRRNHYDIRNSLVIFNKISNFPSLLKHGENIFNAVERICANNHEDIKTIAKSYLAHLKRRRATWMIMGNFIQNAAEDCFT